MLGNISIWQLVIVLAIVILLFGTKKLRTLGGDLGGALRSFKKAVSDSDAALSDNGKLENAQDARFDSTDTRSQAADPVTHK
ncbi:twin-arginine translocase TatA/TatE family subunit [Marinobacterium litorale]|uniref:twin-arginine translocase TatA/TatE family subunit n=1 Tax=Marinobacterium litorale TaxID=404770 RepID=UPI00041A0A06|nr:twin-arginine translocase TatA/TatE family subunit [Marinobacterium litorale]